MPCVTVYIMEILLFYKYIPIYTAARTVEMSMYIYELVISLGLLRQKCNA